MWGRVLGTPCCSLTTPTPGAIQRIDTEVEVRKAQRSARNVPAGTVISSSASTFQTAAPSSDGGPDAAHLEGQGQSLLPGPGREPNPVLAHLHRPGGGIDPAGLANGKMARGAPHLEARDLVRDRVDLADPLGRRLAILPKRTRARGESQRGRAGAERASLAGA